MWVRGCGLGSMGIRGIGLRGMGYGVWVREYGLRGKG
jgi:hypothetical protein